MKNQTPRMVVKKNKKNIRGKKKWSGNTGKIILSAKKPIMGKKPKIIISSSTHQKKKSQKKKKRNTFFIGKTAHGLVGLKIKDQHMTKNMRRTKRLLITRQQYKTS